MRYGQSFYGKSMSGRKTLLSVLVVLGLFAALFAPNLLWLSHSTLKISNGSAWTLEQITIEVTGGREDIETLAASAKVLILLPVSGESDMKLQYRIKTGETVAAEEQGCNAGYIEAGMYHVIAEIDASGAATCSVELASLNRLLIFEMF